MSGRHQVAGQAGTRADVELVLGIQWLEFLLGFQGLLGSSGVSLISGADRGSGGKECHQS